MSKVRAAVAALVVVSGGLWAPHAARAVPHPAYAESSPPSAAYGNRGFTPVMGDFDGDGADDVLLYLRDGGTETVKFGHPDRTFTTSTARTYQVTGTYTPIAGSFEAGDRATDILWYAPGAAADVLWLFHEGGTRTVVTLAINGTYTPIVGDWAHASDRVDDIFWYAPGPAGDSLWVGDGDGTFTSVPQTVNGTFTPLVGSFTPDLAPPSSGIGDPTLDIFWYAPGAAGDSLWAGNDTGTFTKIAKTVSGTYKPFVGRFDATATDDIFWYSETGPDAIWLADPVSGGLVSHAASAGAGYRPIMSDLTRHSPILWWSASGPDSVWQPDGAAGVWSYASDTLNTNMGSGYVPVVGDFDGGGWSDIYWIQPGPGSERLFWGPDAA